MTKRARSIRCPEGVLGWIPWYGERGEDGTGVLTDRQRGAVEAHCAECSDCRAELDMISGAPYEIDVDLPDPDRVFEEITARIAAGEVRAEEHDASTPVIPIGRARRLDEADYGRLAAWILEGESEPELEAQAPAARRERAPAARNEKAPAANNEVRPASQNVIRGPWGRSEAWAAAAAAVLLLAVGGMAGVLFSQFSLVGSGQDVYELAGFEGTVVSEGSESTATGATAVSTSIRVPEVDVIFKQEASVGQISDALRSAGLEIVSGPSSEGVYRLRSVANRTGSVPASPSDAAAIAARLKEASAPLVIFAEPVP